MSNPRRFFPHYIIALLFFSVPNIFAQISIGPYVQQISDSEATIIWYTEKSASGALKFGREINAQTESHETGNGGLHAAHLKNLSPGTRYFYSVLVDGESIASGEHYFFKTAAASGANSKFRFIAFGDMGKSTEEQVQVAEQIESLTPRADFGLLLGDIVYNSGKRKDYPELYFQPYAKTICNTPFWPSIGNHDMKSQNGAAYFEFFYTPANNPAGLEDYYSFDYGNAHFVSLDSENAREDGSYPEMLDWVERDLEAARARGAEWLFAFFHHAPYSEGTHGDDEFVVENYLPRLEKNGVDIVFAGHSHVLERSYLVRSGTVINGHPNKYSKLGHNEGTVYIVSGAGAKQGLSDEKHPLMAFQQEGFQNGVSVIDIDGQVLRGFFRTNDGQEIDHFAIFKDGTTAVREKPDIAQAPAVFSLHQNFPNPFNPRTSFRFSLRQAARVEISIYNTTGALVETAVNEDFAPGEHAVSWTAENLASGVYVYKMTAGGVEKSRKFILLR